MQLAVSYHAYDLNKTSGCVMPYHHLWGQHSFEISSKASKVLDTWLPLQELDFLHL